jgi:hypothetical protein
MREYRLNDLLGQGFVTIEITFHKSDGPGQKHPVSLQDPFDVLFSS